MSYRVRGGWRHCRFARLDPEALLVSRESYKQSGLDQKAHFVLANLERLPFRAVQFDFVYGEDNIKFFQDVSVPLREMTEVTREGGRVAVSAPNLYGHSTDMTTELP
jgi:ubiquinone/menaquinone biosynthesis C-methylase UbiE